MSYCELVISIGNTHIQYGIFETQGNSQPSLVIRQSYQNWKIKIKTRQNSTRIDILNKTKATSIKELSKIKSKFKVVHAHIASVNPTLNTLLIESIHEVFNLPAQVIQHSDIPITILYDPPHAIGIDRLLKIYASSILAPNTNKIIIDFGTAITIDAIEKSTYLGGMIITGFHTSLHSLNHFTEQLPTLTFEDKSKIPPLLGNSVKSCILNGTFHFYQTAINGLIKKVMLQYFKKSTCEVWITGGDSQYFHKNLSWSTKYLEHLNLTALHLIAQKLPHV